MRTPQRRPHGLPSNRLAIAQLGRGVGAVLLTLGTGLATIAPAHAQLVPNPRDRGTPSSTIGGGTRGGGCGDNTDAMPFVNLSEDQSAPGGVSFSVSDPSPSLYVHLPENRPDDAEFIILDGSGTIIERNRIDLAEADNTLKLPVFGEGENARTLEPNKSYRWAFVLICDAQDRGADRGVLGEVRLAD